MAVLLGVRADPAVVLVDEDAHFRQQLHLLLVQVVRRDFRHFRGRSQGGLTAAREGRKVRNKKMQ